MWQQAPIKEERNNIARGSGQNQLLWIGALYRFQWVLYLFHVWKCCILERKENTPDKRHEANFPSIPSA